MWPQGSRQNQQDGLEYTQGEGRVSLVARGLESPSPRVPGKGSDLIGLLLLAVAACCRAGSLWSWAHAQET